MPLTLTVAESRELGEEAEKSGVILMPDLNFRFTPNYVKAKELVEQGAVGKPLSATFSEFIPATDLAAQWPSGARGWKSEIKTSNRRMFARKKKRIAPTISASPKQPLIFSSAIVNFKLRIYHISSVIVNWSNG